MLYIQNIAGVLVCVLGLSPWLGHAPARAQTKNQGPIVTGNPPPTPEQMRALTARAIENQHRNDNALLEYERVEHAVTRKGDNAEVVTDLTERRVPAPAGDIKLKTAENGKPVPPEQYRQEVEFAVKALQTAIHPDDRYKEGIAKYEKRLHDRAEMVDAAGKAFRITWAGRETRPDPSAPHGQRTFMKVFLDPDPEFKPANRLAAIFQHIHATLWVDEEQVQFARLEADISSDISFGGGVAGKLYRGGHVKIEQGEITPGIWLPKVFSYDVDGRKFLFSFGVHERTEITQYRRVGPTAQALEIMRNELNTLSAADPPR